MKKLYKDVKNKKIFGVCAGISDMTKIDVTLIRILTFVLCWFWGTGLLIYLVLAFILPNKN